MKNEKHGSWFSSSAAATNQTVHRQGVLGKPQSTPKTNRQGVLNKPSSRCASCGGK